MTKKNWKADWPRPNTLFSNRLHDILPNKGLSKIAQEYFLGASKNTVSRYLSGDSEPMVSQILRISEVTGCNVLWLLTGEGKDFEGKSDMVNEKKPLHDLTIRNNLKKIRHRFDIDQMFQLCRDSGVSIEDWIDWENGEGWPSKRQLGKISVAANIDPGEIERTLPEDEWPMPTSEKYASAPRPGMASNKPTRSRQDDNVDRGDENHIEMVFQIQNYLSELQLILADAGHHVAAKQSLSNYAGLDSLVKSLEGFELLMKSLVSKLKSYQRTPQETCIPHNDGNHDGSAL